CPAPSTHRNCAAGAAVHSAWLWWIPISSSLSPWSSRGGPCTQRARCAEPSGECRAPRLAGDPHPLAFVLPGKFLPLLAHVGAQLLLAGDAARTLAIAPIVEHDHVEVDFPKTIQVHQAIREVRSAER